MKPICIVTAIFLFFVFLGWAGPSHADFTTGVYTGVGSLTAGVETYNCDGPGNGIHMKITNAETTFQVEAIGYRCSQEDDSILGDRLGPMIFEKGANDTLTQDLDGVESVVGSMKTSFGKPFFDVVQGVNQPDRVVAVGAREKETGEIEFVMTRYLGGRPHVVMGLLNKVKK